MNQINNKENSVLLMNGIEYSDSVLDEHDGIISHYFKAPLHALNNPDKDAVSALISLECPFEKQIPEETLVLISPVDKDGECYDWNDIEIPLDEKEEFLRIVHENLRS